jgi:hypothetical protein
MIQKYFFYKRNEFYSNKLFFYLKKNEMKHIEQHDNTIIRYKWMISSNAFQS